jgi:plasmid stabilization system protein ParE
MRLPLVFRPVARAEFTDAAVWYESRRVGLGTDFIAKVQKVLDTITLQPFRYPVAYRDIREAPVSRFPYCVYYRIKPSRVVVIAVFHTSRDPAVWQARA